MLNCPMCNKPIQEVDERCPTCQANLALIADYIKDLQHGLELADRHTRSGRLGEAVWTYLEVLEIEPDNAIARRQVGRVVTAVRQFDRAAPSRRWARHLQKQTRFRRWLEAWEEGDSAWGWVFWLILVVGALVLGYVLGQQQLERPAPPAQVSTAPR